MDLNYTGVLSLSLFLGQRRPSTTIIITAAMLTAITAAPCVYSPVVPHLIVADALLSAAGSPPRTTSSSLPRPPSPSPPSPRSSDTSRTPSESGLSRTGRDTAPRASRVRFSSRRRRSPSFPRRPTPTTRASRSPTHPSHCTLSRGTTRLSGRASTASSMSLPTSPRAASRRRRRLRPRRRMTGTTARRTTRSRTRPCGR